MIRWQDLIRLPEQQLAAKGIAAVDLACAHGLPGAEAIEVNSCLQTMDNWADGVGRYTQWASSDYQRDPAAYDNSEELFRAAALVTYLQKRIGVHYDPALIDRADFFHDSRNLFIHGVVQSLKGTCGSLPVLVAAVGRRLGYPLKLVQTACHLFVRWEGAGRRFNMECTSRGLNTHPDDHYLRWPNVITPQEAERYGFLKSLTPREELAVFMSTRGHCWLANDDHGQAAESYAYALELGPALTAYFGCLRVTIRRWQEKLRGMMREDLFPRMRLYPPPRRYPALSARMEADIMQLSVVQLLLENPRYWAEWWRPIQEHPGVRPPGYPRHVTVRYPREFGGRIEVTFEFAEAAPPAWCLSG